MQSEIYNESLFNYLVYLPKDHNPSKKYPLLIFLHGSGEVGNDLTMLKCHSIPKICDAKDASFNAIIIAPQCPVGKTWGTLTEKIQEFIADMVIKYNIEEKAISITGISMGGFGTFQIIIAYPKLFSAAAPVCGGCHAWGLAPIKNMPLKIYHGGRDDVVDMFYSLDVYRALKRLGSTNAELHILPDGYHDIWDYVYEQTDVINWLISQKNA